MAYKHDKEIDWTAIEADYRAGVLSNRELAAKHEVSEAAIRARAKRYGWVKGDPYAVRELAYQRADNAGLPVIPVDPAERIEELGKLSGDIIISHRRQLALLRGIAADLSQELLDATRNRDMIEERIIEFYAAKMEMSPIAVAAYRKQMGMALAAVGLGNRSKTALNLANTLKTVIDQERTNYRLDEDTGDKTYEDLLKEVHAKVTKPVEGRDSQQVADGV
jgi:hypothetical protein